VSKISLCIPIAMMILLVAGARGDEASQPLDARVLGAWKPVSYTVNGQVHSMRGLMIITPDYFVANTIYQNSAGAWTEANANSGPYSVKNGKIALTQWMQLHYRPSNPKDMLLTEGIVEQIGYTLDNGKLVMHFPSGNSYTSERLRPAR
jgi:hypothetical protein